MQIDRRQSCRGRTKRPRSKCVRSFLLRSDDSVQILKSYRRIPCRNSYMQLKKETNRKRNKKTRSFTAVYVGRVRIVNNLLDSAVWNSIHSDDSTQLPLAGSQDAMSHSRRIGHAQATRFVVGRAGEALQ